MTALRPTELAILLALSRGHAHGYQIRTHLAPIFPLPLSTLYKALHRMIDQGLVTDAGMGQGSHGGSPQRRYRLTETGEQRVLQDVARMRALLWLVEAA